MKTDYKAIIFDASNTLFFGDGNEFEQANLYSVYYYLWRKGIDLNAEDIDIEMLWTRWQALRQRPKGDLEHRQLTSTKADLKELFSTIETVKLDAKFLNKLEAVYYEGVVAATQSLPEMFEVLTALSKNYKLLVLSNTRSHYFIEESICRAGLLDFFELVVTSDVVGWRKPIGRIFESALAGVGLEPTQTIMIGDSLEKDIAGAKALGMKTIWLSLNSTSKLSDTKTFPDAEAKHPLELLSIIDSLK